MLEKVRNLSTVVVLLIACAVKNDGTTKRFYKDVAVEKLDVIFSNLSYNAVILIST